MNTAHVAKPIVGNKLYQKRARNALPILVRQAQAEAPIYYSDLAQELNMSNPRNLNYVLGSIGQTLNNLTHEWKEKVPPIQCLVINKHTGLPGEGIGWFISDMTDYGQLSRKQQRQRVDVELNKIFTFRKWHEVLKELGLTPVYVDFKKAVSNASKYRAGGESKSHLRLKEFVAGHPEILYLPTTLHKGQTEVPLPSGDILDVLFKTNDEDIGVEVKSNISAEPDIVRGLFQCIKYRAVLEAMQATETRTQNAKAILVFEGNFPQNLLSLKNILGVEVIDHIKINNG